MNRSSASSAPEKAATALLWGCELNQEKRTWTFKPQREGKQDCRLSLSTVCLGENAKEEMNLVEVLPPAGREDKKTKPVTIASLQASVLPMTLQTYPGRRRSWRRRRVTTTMMTRMMTMTMVTRPWRRRPLSNTSRGWCPRSRRALPRPGLQEKSPVGKAKATLRPKKPGSRK
ncbi:nucleoplasmin-2 isoform X3 [Equus caballus]|uniref:nucleoplasmin-2 isoform X3 n=1 Tax=Equus caballus TaxID=9796 RepID=UPI0038B3725E